MPFHPRSIETDDDVAHALALLKQADPRLARVHEVAGAVPLRRSVGGLKGLVGIVIAQQVSRASAAAIFSRLSASVDLEDPAALLAASEETLKAAGLSGAKRRTLAAIGEAVAGSRLDLARLADIDANEAIAEMSAVKGIGPWTAECYLLFAVGHPDVFPAGDLALQVAVAHALALPERPDARALRTITGQWSPHRATAARLFWAYYAAVTRRDAVPVERAAEKPEEKAIAARGRRHRGFTKAT